MKIREILAKSVLTPSKLPGADRVINPYVGCSFGCQYCYASFIGRWKHPGEEWGSFVDVKINAPEILKQELERLRKKTDRKDFGAIFFSSVTDPYLGSEIKYQITRKCLKVLANFGYEGMIGIQTKSPLVFRDIDVLRKLKKIEVGFTITTLDDKTSRFLEGNAPLVSSRLAALEKLNRAGISTYAFVGPILPYFMTSEKTFSNLFQKIQDTGTKYIWLEHINLSPKIRSRLFAYLAKTNPELISEFSQAQNQEYRRQLERIIQKALRGKKLKVLGGGVIYHNAGTKS